MQRVRSGPISNTFGIILRAGARCHGANLFIYTLPSSPIGEAAIHFGFLGPVLYAAGEGNALSVVLDMANEMVLADEAPVMLAGKAEADEALFFVMRTGTRSGSVGPLRGGGGPSACGNGLTM